MSFHFSGAAVALVFVSLLAGCASPPQKPVDLAPDYFASGKAKTGRIGVVMSVLPKPDTVFPGAFCLLCLGVANMAHSALNKEVQTFSTDELKPLPAALVELLNKQGLDAVLIDEPLKLADLPDLGASDPTNKARKNFGALKSKHNLARLLVVNITYLGVSRAYASYVPTDLPKAVLYGNVSLVELNTHGLEWFQQLELSRAADGAWDEPPKFPGLSNAYYQVLEAGMDSVKKQLSK